MKERIIIDVAQATVPLSTEMDVALLFNSSTATEVTTTAYADKDATSTITDVTRREIAEDFFDAYPSKKLTIIEANTDTVDTVEVYADKVDLEAALKSNAWAVIVCDKNVTPQTISELDVKEHLFFYTLSTVVEVNAVTQLDRMVYVFGDHQTTAEWVGLCLKKGGHYSWDMTKMITTPPVPADQTAISACDTNDVVYFEVSDAGNDLSVGHTVNGDIKVNHVYSTDLVVKRLRSGLRAMLVDGKLNYDGGGFELIRNKQEEILEAAGDGGNIQYNDAQSKFEYTVTMKPPAEQETADINNYAMKSSVAFKPPKYVSFIYLSITT